ncbi:MAG TPA: ubiquinone/menaquinone biosynthesis methyltransferase [Candidatus Acidoferrales bacterium]|jgi:ubiquinone/menaquinone biosynthesis methyltransferase|nr:ubiquinone/menaquinone biosynthesis methyltransferase [Candidatus Acidoferrales bacterium]
MKSPEERQDSRLMRQMFDTIAPRYDFVSRVFSFGLDGRWKRLSVARAALPEKACVLDLACGTGDLSLLVVERQPEATVIPADITELMLRLARARGLKNTVCSDAACLPFAGNSFDCVFIGYGLRNFPDLKAAVQEIKRVTRPGGSIVSVDFFMPSNAVLREIYLGYLYAQGAVWGLLLHGRARVYTYIPDSLRSFLTIREFSALLEDSGYEQVVTRSYFFGGIGQHWAVKK